MGMALLVVWCGHEVSQSSITIGESARPVPRIDAEACADAGTGCGWGSSVGAGVCAVDAGAGACAGVSSRSRGMGGGSSRSMKSNATTCPDRWPLGRNSQLRGEIEAKQGLFTR